MTGAPRGYTARDVHHVRRVRRFAVPRPMIEWATERRLAGDWRGACDAARVDTVFDMARLPRWYGKEFLDALEEELRHLVPDLVRWHFPRVAGGTLLEGGVRVVLSRPGGDGGPWLTVRARESQWLELDLLGNDAVRPGWNPRHPPAIPWTASRYLWDDRHVHETRERWGGGPDRAPFLNPDGTPRCPDLLPTEDPGPGDPAARTEWIGHLHRTGRADEARAALGGGPPPEWKSVGVPPRPETGWALPPDIDAVLAGVSPDHLHPVVRDALAPARPPADGPVGPPGPEPPGPVTVPCGGARHLMEFSGGRLRVREEAHRRREEALAALGGPRTGCLAVEEAWTGGLEVPSEDLERIREDLFERARHGDTDGVLHYLDRGGDPRVRARTGETLLHHLAALGHEVLLPRLLAGGLDVDARDGKKRTALLTAARRGGGVSLLRALHAAGADWLDADESERLLMSSDALPVLVFRRARSHDGAQWDDLGTEMFGPGWQDRVARREWPRRPERPGAGRRPLRQRKDP
ncbi:ankyrin repeat domain-containing protein [Nocardiopsis sp. CC223A]|uniref:ankyrin repeat domain-containing protein n=1 Tax=Nocardiopsis sp. CC223A TaxID=3044051 RepID=UPI00278BEFBD|nr:ankyrin repeat domain-containing protein [Nocardiopsis sp. CC223A]